MSREPRPPLFGFVFAPKPAAPGSGQERWLRIPHRGPWRLALLITSTLALAVVGGSALLALAGTRSVSGLAIGVIALLISLPVIMIVARGWVVGTFVNDSGIRIVRLVRSDFIPWSIVDELTVVPVRWGQHLVVATADGIIPTTIGSRTLDTAWREQTWLSSVDRMRIWHSEASARD